MRAGLASLAFPDHSERSRSRTHDPARPQIRKAAIVAFGDSRGESGLDAWSLARMLGLDGRAYNLSSHGQKLGDSFLLYQECPPSVATVIQFVNREDLGASNGFDTQTFNALYLYGYRPNDETRRVIGESFGAAAASIVDSGGARQAVSSRWTLRQAVDILLRTSFRRDLRLESARDDLYFPTPFTGRMDERAFQAPVRDLRRVNLPEQSLP